MGIADTPQQAQVQGYLDKDLRASLLNLARALAQASISVVPQYLSSPSGLPSTMAAPAADSVAGILATLTAGEVIPISTSGLALAGSPLASKVAAYTVASQQPAREQFHPGNPAGPRGLRRVSEPHRVIAGVSNGLRPISTWALLLSTKYSIMAFGSGSNLNAGSTSGAAVYTSTAGNWDVTNVFTPTDGQTTTSFVNVGDWVSHLSDRQHDHAVRRPRSRQSGRASTARSRSAPRRSSARPRSPAPGPASARRAARGPISGSVPPAACSTRGRSPRRPGST
jgi:hypothetical protein